MGSLDLMVDFETKALGPRATILTLGAVVFDPTGYGIVDRFYCKPDLEEQATGFHRDVDESTLKWWSEQSDEVRAEAFGDEGRLPLDACWEQFEQFCRKHNVNHVWSHGLSFDVPILVDVARSLGKQVPWKFWNERDTRTLFDLENETVVKSEQKHNALVDATLQAEAVQRAMRRVAQRKQMQ